LRGDEIRWHIQCFWRKLEGIPCVSEVKKSANFKSHHRKRMRYLLSFYSSLFLSPSFISSLGFFSVFFFCRLCFFPFFLLLPRSFSSFLSSLDLSMIFLFPPTNFSIPAFLPFPLPVCFLRYLVSFSKIVRLAWRRPISLNRSRPRQLWLASRQLSFLWGFWDDMWNSAWCNCDRGTCACGFCLLETLPFGLNLEPFIISTAKPKVS